LATRPKNPHPKKYSILIKLIKKLYSKTWNHAIEFRSDVKILCPKKGADSDDKGGGELPNKTG
jgi:hypothetical protein